MKRLPIIFWACMAFPWAVGIYVFGWPGSSDPIADGTFRPWLERSFTYYGMAAVGLQLAELAAPSDDLGVRPTSKTTMLLLHAIAAVSSFSIAFDKSGCRLSPLWGCLEALAS